MTSGIQGLDARRRYPLETCFSCCRPCMTADGQGRTHRFEDPAAYRNASDRTLLDPLRSTLGIVDIQSAR